MINFPRIIDAKRTPAIGEWFSVPHYPLRVPSRRMGGRSKKYWNGKAEFAWLCPVLLPGHENNKLLNFPFWHYHIDFRFFSKNEILSFYKNSRMKDSVKDAVHDIVNDLVDIISIITTKDNTPDFRRIVWKDKICQRNLDNNNIELKAINKHFSGIETKCLRCPHKNINLADRQPDENGIITCPSHGLKMRKEGNSLICL